MVCLLLSQVGPIIFLLRSYYRTTVHAQGFSLSKLLFLSFECHLKNFDFESDTMCRADTQMFLSVSASIAREMSCTQMWQYPGVLCNTPGEFYSFFFFPPTTISAVLGPLSQPRPFHLAILPLHSTLIQSTHSLFTLFWIEKASGSVWKWSWDELRGKMSPKGFFFFL